MEIHLMMMMMMIEIGVVSNLNEISVQSDSCHDETPQNRFSVAMISLEDAEALGFRRGFFYMPSSASVKPGLTDIYIPFASEERFSLFLRPLAAARMGSAPSDAA